MCVGTGGGRLYIKEQSLSVHTQNAHLFVWEVVCMCVQVTEPRFL